MNPLAFTTSSLFSGQEAIQGVGKMSGIEMQEAEPSAPSGVLGGLLEQGTDILSPQQEINSKFAERNKNIIKGMKNIDSLSDTLSGAAMKSGNPIAMATGALMKVGSAVGKSAEDEFGVVKDKGKAIVGGILNPIRGLSTAFGQKDRKEAKTRFVNTELASKAAEAQVAGNKITNSIPRYTPPGYGRFGRKL